MKVRVNIDHRWFEVELDSLNTNPVIARVDGEPVEVWLDKQPANNGGAASSGEMVSRAEQTGAVGSGIKDIRAPIPGVILSIAVREGDTVAYGDELCILEAMKMKNIIRSPRAGVVANIAVSTGEAVKHGELLIGYQE